MILRQRWLHGFQGAKGSGTVGLDQVGEVTGAVGVRELCRACPAQVSNCPM